MEGGAVVAHIPELPRTGREGWRGEPGGTCAFVPAPTPPLPVPAQGKTLGLVGAGRIGTAYAKMMVEGHKMNLLYQSRRPHPQVTSYFE